jgi:hypothetical protein
MRIKIIGENNCARATRHLLRLAGFAVTDLLPADAVIQGPAAGYAITIDLSPATHTPNAHLGPDRATQQQKSSTSEEADRIDRDASLPSFAENQATGSKPFLVESVAGTDSVAGSAGGGLASYIHFDSVDSALEAAVLRHVAQLAAGPVIVDRPGGVVHSERELRIVAPVTGDARVDEAAVAIEFGVLRGLLDLVAPDARSEKRWNGAGKRLLRGDGESAAAENLEGKFDSRSKKFWWPFFLALFALGLGVWSAGHADLVAASGGAQLETAQRALLAGGVQDVALEGHRLKPVLLVAAPLAAEPQGQFATGQGVKITDGVNVFVMDPCKAQTKFYASISQTGNTQLIAGTVSKKMYVCSIHVVAAAATDVAVVEGTGSVCGTGTAGVSGFGGATAATGWNFAGNGGIALGNGDSSLGAEGTSGDNLCVFNSGSGQVSGGISYVVE